MFDHVGHTEDAEATRRSLASLVLSSLLLGAGAAFVTAWGAFTAVSALHDEPEPDDTPLAEVVLLDPVLDLAPPPPPPPAGRAAPEVAPDPDRVEPDEAVDVPPELEEPDPEIRDAARPAGDPQGTADGENGGEVGGRPGGRKDGVPHGTPGGTGEIRAFHHSELATRVRVDPVFPAEAMALGVAEHRCRVAVTIDARGVPTDVQVTGCPEVFHANAREALLRWRWYPPRDGRAKVAARTLISVVFRAE